MYVWARFSRKLEWQDVMENTVNIFSSSLHWEFSNKYNLVIGFDHWFGCGTGKNKCYLYASGKKIYLASEYIAYIINKVNPCYYFT